MFSDSGQVLNDCSKPSKPPDAAVCCLLDLLEAHILEKASQALKGFITPSVMYRYQYKATFQK